MNYFYYKFFDRAKEENINAIKLRKPHSQILSFSYFPSFIFKKNLVFIEESSTSQKVVIVEKGLDNIDDIGNLHWEFT